MSQAIVYIGSLLDIIRDGRWQRAIDRYGPLQKLLIDVEVRLPKEKKVVLDDMLKHAIEQLSIMEDESGKTVIEGTEIDAAGFHSMLLSIQKDMNNVHAELERELTNTS